MRIQETAVWASLNNTFSENTLLDNALGVSVSLASDNLFYLNEFLNNTIQAQVTAPINNVTSVNGINSANGVYVLVNRWDNGSRGNYWSDYAARYPQAQKSSDLWETAYLIDQNNTDNHPLINRLCSTSPQEPFQLWVLAVLFIITLVIVSGAVYILKCRKIT